MCKYHILLNILKNLLYGIRLSAFGISVTYKNGTGSLRLNPHCRVYNNFLFISSSGYNDFTIKSNLAARLLKNIYQRHSHRYLCLWFDWRRIYPINTSFKKLERSGTIKHTMYIWIPVRKIFPNQTICGIIKNNAMRTKRVLR